MKICHMTSVHKSDDTRIFYKECVSLTKADYETYLVAQGDSFDRDGVHIVGIGTAPGSRLKRMMQTAKKVYETAIALDADLYHFHDPELLPYGVKLKKKGKIVIFDSHENTLQQMEEKPYIPKLLRPIAGTLYRVYAGRAFRRMDAIVSVTPHICSQLEPYNQTVRMVTNYPFLPPKLEEKQPRQTAEIRLGFAGRVTEQWCHTQILEALSSVPQTVYEVWGDVDPDYLLELQAIKGYAQAVFYGKVPHAEVTVHLATLDVGLALVRYSRNSGGKLGTLGNTKIFEYMSVGIPVICTDFTLWQEIVDKYHCGICVDPTDVQAITDAITYLRDHPEETREMGQNGRRAVEEVFNWATQEKTLLALYSILFGEEGNRI